MKRKDVNIGLYLGDNFVTAAATKGKQLLASAKFSLSSLREDTQEAILTEGVLWEALINKSIREVEGDDSDIHVSLADKDFIFRSFEMPLMGKKEIESAIAFEVEKYLPFKIDDLIWDYSYATAAKEKKINLSFLGIRNNIYKKYKDLFAHLNIKVLRIEPCAISLVRLIKSQRDFKKINNFALLDFCDTESYITFFYKELPIFNRYLNIPQVGGSLDIERLKEEVRISIQYFKREFRRYQLDRLIILSNSASADVFSDIHKEIDVDCQTLKTDELLETQGLSVEHMKAYAVSANASFLYKFNPRFRDATDMQAARDNLLWEVPFNFKLILGSIVFGVLACLFFHMYLGNLVSFKRMELASKEKDITADFPKEFSKKPLKVLRQELQSQKRKKSKLSNRFDQMEMISVLIDKLPYFLTEGLWFDRMNLQKNADGGVVLSIKGYVFLDDVRKEQNSLDRFINKLQKSAEFSNAFSKIDLANAERAKFLDYDVYSFWINLE